MSSYKDLQSQIVALQKKADEARQSESAAAIAEIKAKMKDYDITVADLGFKGVGKVEKRQTKVVPPKYRDPKTEKTWTGRGKAPVWIADALKAGKANNYLISVQQEKAAAKADKPVAAPVPAKKAPAKKAAQKKAPVKAAPKKETTPVDAATA